MRRGAAASSAAGTVQVARVSLHGLTMCAPDYLCIYALMRPKLEVE
jgi:hypothetical protein